MAEKPKAPKEEKKEAPKKTASDYLTRYYQVMSQTKGDMLTSANVVGTEIAKDEDFLKQVRKEAYLSLGEKGTKHVEIKDEDLFKHVMGTPGVLEDTLLGMQLKTYGPVLVEDKKTNLVSFDFEKMAQAYGKKVADDVISNLKSTYDGNITEKMEKNIRARLAAQVDTIYSNFEGRVKDMKGPIHDIYNRLEGSKEMPGLLQRITEAGNFETKIASEVSVPEYINSKKAAVKA